MTKVRLVSQTQITDDYMSFLVKEHIGEKEGSEFIKNMQKPEGLVAYLARVSSPNPTNPNYAKLLKYCLEHKHVSVFEMIDYCFEIETTIAISQQLLRHKSLSFQQISRRYSSESVSFSKVEARRQDKKNRQNSISDLDQETQDWFLEAQEEVCSVAKTKYDEALAKGIAKEQARFILPQNTVTKLYAKGNLRSWIHYLQVRNHPDTQKEHRELAEKIQEILKKECPIVAEALGW